MHSKIIICEEGVDREVILHTRVGKPERVCLDFSDGDYEGLGQVVYTMRDAVLRDGDDDEIKYRSVIDTRSRTSDLPTQLSKYMVAIDTSAPNPRVPMLVTRVGRKYGYTRPCNDPIRGSETKYDIDELLLMVHDHIREPVPTYSVLIDGVWHPTVAHDPDHKTKSIRYFFDDGTFVDVDDGEHTSTTVKPPGEDVFKTYVDVDTGIDDPGDVVDVDIMDDDCTTSTKKNDFDSAPLVCGVVDHQTQSLMDDCGSIYSGSGSDSDYCDFD